MSTKILIADDHGIVRMGISQVVKEVKPGSIVVEARDYDSLFAAIRRETFDLLILDINMPNGTFQEAVEFIKIKQPALKILIFSAQDEGLYAIRYLKMGAHGFLNKFSSKQEIDVAVQSMLSRGRYYSEEIKETLLFNSVSGKNGAKSPLEVLSDRELEIAEKLIEGLSTKDLSIQLNIHNSTVSTYKARIFQKLGVQSVPGLLELFKLYQSC